MSATVSVCEAIEVEVEQASGHDDVNDDVERGVRGVEGGYIRIVWSVRFNEMGKGLEDIGHTKSEAPSKYAITTSLLNTNRLATTGCAASLNT